MPGTFAAIATSKGSQGCKTFTRIADEAIFSRYGGLYFVLYIVLFNPARYYCYFIG